MSEEEGYPCDNHKREGDRHQILAPLGAVRALASQLSSWQHKAHEMVL